MISHGKDIKIFTGNANPKLAADICKIIGTKLGESEVKSFADGEASVSLYETVRGSDVFLVQSTCKPVNDSLMELLIMVDACRRAGVRRLVHTSTSAAICVPDPEGPGALVDEDAAHPAEVVEAVGELAEHEAQRSDQVR